MVRWQACPSWAVKSNYCQHIHCDEHPDGIPTYLLALRSLCRSRPFSFLHRHYRRSQKALSRLEERRYKDCWPIERFIPISNVIVSKKKSAEHASKGGQGYRGVIIGSDRMFT